MAALSHPLIAVIIIGRRSGKERAENKAPRALVRAIMAATMVVPAAKPRPPLIIIAAKRTGNSISYFIKRINEGTITNSSAPNSVRLKKSFPMNTAWGRAESLKTSIVPASSSLTKERDRPERAEKTRMIHKSTAYKNGFSASAILNEPIEKLTATSVVTANIRIALTA